MCSVFAKNCVEISTICTKYLFSCCDSKVYNTKERWKGKFKSRNVRYHLPGVITATTPNICVFQSLDMKFQEIKCEGITVTSSLCVQSFVFPLVVCSSGHLIHNVILPEGNSSILQASLRELNLGS